MGARIPRIIVAGLSGDSGKTIASLSLLTALRQRGLAVSVFKKGPDYIDAAWLSQTAGCACRNLDTFMVDPQTLMDCFSQHASHSDIAVIEGNRGLFDGKDIHGTHSTAALARLVSAPVVLVVNGTKSTRTLAALVKGCIDFDPEVKIGGVILNRVTGKRHRQVATETIEHYCQVPVLGVIPKLGGSEVAIPGRHLGLVTPAEFDHQPALDTLLAEIANQYLDIDGLLKVANEAGEIDRPATVSQIDVPKKVSLGVFRDSVFTFYYPENLEALEKSGATLVPLSSLETASLPKGLDGLYIGGGFPETQVERLTQNRSLMNSVRLASQNGLPVYAECGGLMYLSRSVRQAGQVFQMAGVFPVDLEMNKRPVGHGYTELVIDGDNPFLPLGSTIRGHEFHYSGVTGKMDTTTCAQVTVGVGLGSGRDGLRRDNTLALYTHLHADGVRGWAEGFVSAAGRYRSERSSSASGETDPASEESDPAMRTTLATRVA